MMGATDARLVCAMGATGARRSRAAAPRAGRTHARGAFSAAAAAAAPAILKRLFRSQAAGRGVWWVATRERRAGQSAARRVTGEIARNDARRSARARFVVRRDGDELAR